jgi:tetratricopeptide (TPR) repeat protein
MRKRHHSLFILFLCLLAFLPIFSADFINYDDPEYVLNNLYIKKLSWDNIRAVFEGKATILYVPLTIFSYMLEYSLFGQNPKVFHTVNLLLHIANALLLFRILCRLKIENIYLVGFILAFFALSPLVTESVCWVTERKDVLYCFFFFLSTLQFLNYYESKQVKYLVICFFLFLLACFSKPMAVSLPALFLVFIVYRSQKFELRKFLFLLPFFLVSAIFSVVSVLFIHNKASAQTALSGYSTDQKLFLLLSEIGYYFVKPFAPFSQQLIQLFPDKSRFYSTTPIIVFGVAGIALIVAMAYWIFARKNKLAGALFLCWLIFLIPVLQIYPNTNSYVSERYFYVSIIFPVALVYLFLNERGISRQSFKFALILLIPLFAILTFKRSKVWTNTQTLFEQELKTDDKDPFALNNLGYYYNSKAQFDKGYQLLQRAVSIDANNPLYLNNYGWALAGLGQTDSAIVYFEKAITRKKNFVDAMNNLGVCYMQKNQADKAFTYFNQAYSLGPDNNEALYNLGAYYLKTGQTEKARPLIKRAYELGNKSAAGYLLNYPH